VTTKSTSSDATQASKTDLTDEEIERAIEEIRSTIQKYTR
jgi:hypothetical protein